MIRIFFVSMSPKPAPDGWFSPPALPLLEEAWVRPYSQDDEDYEAQAGDLDRIMSRPQQQRLAATIRGGLSRAEASVQERMLGYLGKADRDYARDVREALAGLGQTRATASVSPLTDEVAV